jgi:c-di-GMP-binding flagellar brake protein YcgR
VGPPHGEVLLRQYKRDHPRIAVELLVEIVPPDRPVIHASTVNLSRAGFQLHADGEMVSVLFPRTTQPAPGDRVSVTVRLRVPREREDAAFVETRCEAVFSRRVAENEYRIGLQFGDMSEEDEALLDAYIDSR